MEMSNSSLVTYRHITKHRDSGRGGHKIEKIFVHHMAGVLSVKQCGNVFNTRPASAHYGVSGTAIGQYVDEKDTAWHCGNYKWNQRSVGIELANSTGAKGGWKVSKETIATAVKLIADICRRNNIKRLTYTGDMRGNLCMHRWVASTTCPGPYLSEQFHRITYEVNKILGAKIILDVDGIGGPLTVLRMQDFLGTEMDGVISGQNKDYAKHYPALEEVIFDDTSSTCIKALQRMLSVYEDGILGPTTVKAWQKFLGVKIDGNFGPASMKAWQKYLNEHDKAVFPETHAPAPVVEKPKKVTSTKKTSKKKHEPTPKMAKALEWAKKIAADPKFHYVSFGLGKKAHECPICHKHEPGKYYGGNCIWFPFASWHHGAGLGNRCSCHVLTNQLYEKMLKVKASEALKIAKERIGLDDIKLLRSKKGIDPSKLRPGDIVIFFRGDKYVHTGMWVDDGLIVDCTSGRKDNIKYGRKNYTKWTIKLAIRYTGE